MKEYHDTMFLLYANSNIDYEGKSFKLLCIPSKDTIPITEVNATLLEPVVVYED